jgi:hypothetical protein
MEQAVAIAPGLELLVGDQSPGGVHEVHGLGAQHFRTVEGLPGAVDVHPADLHEPVGFAQPAHALQLLGGVARRHVGYGTEAEPLHLDRQLVEPRVLEALGLLVARGRFAHVAEVAVARDCADRDAQTHDVHDRHALLPIRLEKDPAEKAALQHPQQVVGEEPVHRIGEQRGQVGGNGQPQPVDDPRGEARPPPGGVQDTPGQREKQVTLRKGTAGVGARDRPNVAREVEGPQAEVRQQRVEALRHAVGAALTGSADGLQERRDFRETSRGDAVEHDVHQARRVGVVDHPSGERGARGAHPELDPRGRRNAEAPAGFGELARATDAVVVHDADRGQARSERLLGGRGRRVRAEGVGGVDVVVDLDRSPRWHARMMTAPGRRCQRGAPRDTIEACPPSASSSTRTSAAISTTPSAWRTCSPIPAVSWPASPR